MMAGTLGHYLANFKFSGKVLDNIFSAISLECDVIQFFFASPSTGSANLTDLSDS